MAWASAWLSFPVSRERGWALRPSLPPSRGQRAAVSGSGDAACLEREAEGAEGTSLPTSSAEPTRGPSSRIPDKWPTPAPRAHGRRLAPQSHVLMAERVLGPRGGWTVPRPQTAVVRTLAGGSLAQIQGDPALRLPQLQASRSFRRAGDQPLEGGRRHGSASSPATDQEAARRAEGCPGGAQPWWPGCMAPASRLSGLARDAAAVHFQTHLPPRGRLLRGEGEGVREAAGCQWPGGGACALGGTRGNISACRPPLAWAAL